MASARLSAIQSSLNKDIDNVCRDKICCRYATNMAKHKTLIIAILDRNITQIELAKRTHIHESRLSRFVNGHDLPNADEQRRIAKVLRKDVRELWPIEEVVTR